MGIMSTTGSKDKAPEYFSSSIGEPSWSGVSECDFTEQIKNDLMQFIIFEARRQGWNDKNNGKELSKSSIFHPEFFEGAVHRMWIENYDKGVKEYEKQHTQDGEMDASTHDWNEYQSMIAEEFEDDKD